MSTAATWTGETVRPSDLEQLGSAVFFCTEQFEESGQTQTLLTVNYVFRHVVTYFGFLGIMTCLGYHIAITLYVF